MAISTGKVQFTGLASGLDTDAIVKAMLSTQKARIDAVNQKKILLEWKKEIWTETNKAINKFQTDFVDKLRFESTFNVSKATSSSTAATVTASGEAAEGLHELTIEKLAAGVFVAGEMNLEAGVDVSAKLRDLIGLTANEVLKINDKSITITKDDTLQTVVKKIKEADSSLDVSFDTKNNKLFISTKQTGESAKLKIDTAGGGVLDRLGFSNMNTHGTNAEYTYNGTVSLTSESNNIQINGLNINLNDTTAVGEKIKIQISKDTDKVVEFMSKFVEAYNTLIDDLNTKLYTKSTSSKPLADAEKEKMTDKQIEDYEANIKKTLLRRDESLRTLVGTMRSDLQSVVKGNAFGSLSKIGITTGYYSEKGKLTLDKDELKKALEENINGVMELFTSKGTTNVSGKVSNRGIGTILDSSFKALEKSIKDTRSYDSFYNDKLLQDNIKTSKERIYDLEKKYSKMEAIYYKKFTALEKAMTQMNTQGASISSWLQ